MHYRKGGGADQGLVQGAQELCAAHVKREFNGILYELTDAIELANKQQRFLASHQLNAPAYAASIFKPYLHHHCKENAMGVSNELPASVAGRRQSTCSSTQSNTLNKTSCARQEDGQREELIADETSSDAPNTSDDDGFQSQRGKEAEDGDANNLSREERKMTTITR
jgi:hypothetical protein